MPQSFTDLIASRKQWLEDVLKPWCRQATRAELLKAVDEWHDIAGRVDPEFTLWLWAWSRFPTLHVDDLQGLDETYRVCVTLRDGTHIVGFPDARQSRRGMLILLIDNGESSEPISIDNVEHVARVSDLG